MSGMEHFWRSKKKINKIVRLSKALSFHYHHCHKKSYLLFNKVREVW